MTESHHILQRRLTVSSSPRKVPLSDSNLDPLFSSCDADYNTLPYNEIIINTLMFRYKTTPILILTFFFCLPAMALAHQPRLVESRLTTVSDPEISKAYYGKLSGESDVYLINAAVPFNLYG